MAITNTSYLKDINANERVVFTVADLAEWNTITTVPTATAALLVANPTMALTTQIGLFSFDLTKTKAACLATYTNLGNLGCQSKRIDEYDGFAIGLYTKTLTTDALAFAAGNSASTDKYNAL